MEFDTAFLLRRPLDHPPSLLSPLLAPRIHTLQSYNPQTLPGRPERGPPSSQAGSCPVQPGSTQSLKFPGQAPLLRMVASAPHPPS